MTWSDFFIVGAAKPRGRTVQRRAHSLPELLVCLGIIGILLSFVLPAVQRVRSSAGKTDCLNRLHQIGIALHNYHSQAGGLPAGVGPSSSDLWPDPEAGASWLVRILPYIDQDPLAQAAREAFAVEPRAWIDPPHVGIHTVVRYYICPSDSRLQKPLVDSVGRTTAYSSYLGVIGGFTSELNGVLGMRPGIQLTDVVDGTSTTLMVGERPPTGDLGTGWWYTFHPALDGYLDTELPAESATTGFDGCGGNSGDNDVRFVYAPGKLENRCDKYHFWSLHPGGANFLFADGSGKFLSYSVRPVLRALATRNGNELVDLP